MPQTDKPELNEDSLADAIKNIQNMTEKVSGEEKQEKSKFEQAISNASELKSPSAQTEVVSPFQESLRQMINKHSRENMSDTPDFILAKFLENCLTAYSVAVSSRDHFFGVNMWSKLNPNETEQQHKDIVK